MYAKSGGQWPETEDPGHVWATSLCTWHQSCYCKDFIGSGQSYLQSWAGITDIQLALLIHAGIQHLGAWLNVDAGLHFEGLKDLLFVSWRGSEAWGGLPHPHQASWRFKESTFGYHQKPEVPLGGLLRPRETKCSLPAPQNTGRHK